MFCSRTANYRIDKLHERALIFSDLLARDGSFTIRHTNIQTLLLEMHETKHNLSESCLKDLFSVINCNYNLRSQSDFGVPGINTVFHGANSIRCFGTVIWNSLPDYLRNICDFDLFKMTIWRWKPVDCPC